MNTQHSVTPSAFASPIDDYLRTMDNQKDLKTGFHSPQPLDPSLTLGALAALGAKAAVATGALAFGAAAGHNLGKKVANGSNTTDDSDARVSTRLRQLSASGDPSFSELKEACSVDQLLAFRATLAKN